MVRGGVLDLVDKPQHAVVHQHDFDVHVLAANGCQLVHSHLEGAVTAHHHGLAIGGAHLGADGGRQSVAHGAQTAAGEQAAVLLGQIFAGKDLVLAHIGAHHRVVGQLFAQLTQHRAGEHIAIPSGEGAAELRLAVVAQLRQPCFGIGDGDILFQQLLQNHLHIAHQRDGGGHVLADLRRVHINVDGGHAVLNVGGVDHGPVSGSGAHHNEQVAFGQRLVGAVVAVGAHHAQIEGVVGGQDRDAHHGLDHGDVAPLGQRHQLVPGVGQPHAAAGQNQGLTGLGNGVHHALDLQVVAPHTGLVASNGHFLHGSELFQCLVLNVNGNVDKHRAGTAGGGDVEGLRHHPGQRFRVLDQIAVFDEGGDGAGDIHLLENIPAQQVAGHLPGDGHHGDGVHVGGGDAGDEVGRPRAGGDHTHAHFAADPGIARGHVAGILLGTHQGIADFRRGGQHIHDGADGRAGVAKDMLYLLQFQAFYKGLRSGHGKHLQ